MKSFFACVMVVAMLSGSLYGASSSSSSSSSRTIVVAPTASSTSAVPLSFSSMPVVAEDIGSLSSKEGGKLGSSSSSSSSSSSPQSAIAEDIGSSTSVVGATAGSSSSPETKEEAEEEEREEDIADFLLGTARQVYLSPAKAAKVGAYKHVLSPKAKAILEEAIAKPGRTLPQVFYGETIITPEGKIGNLPFIRRYVSNAQGQISQGLLWDYLIVYGGDNPTASSLLEALIKEGLDPRVPVIMRSGGVRADSALKEAITYAIWTPEYIRQLQIILASKLLNINERYAGGETPLIYAIQEYLKLVKARPDMVKNMEESEPHEYSFIETILLDLLDRGADIATIADNKGKTALDYAQEYPLIKKLLDEVLKRRAEPITRAIRAVPELKEHKELATIMGGYAVE